LFKLTGGELGYFPNKYIYTTTHPVPKLRKRRENVTDVNLTFEPNFLFAASLLCIFFGFHVLPKPQDSVLK
jgi:hypothetical protein